MKTTKKVREAAYAFAIHYEAFLHPVGETDKAYSGRRMLELADELGIDPNKPMLVHVRDNIEFYERMADRARRAKLEA